MEKKITARGVPRKPDASLTPEQFWSAHGRDVGPPELAPAASLSLDEMVGEDGAASRHERIGVEGVASVPRPPSRINKGDIPRGTFFHEEMGVLLPPPTDNRTPREMAADLHRWAKLADAVVRAITEMRQSMDERLETPELALKAIMSRRPRGFTELWPVLASPGLAELAALHHALYPDWRAELANEFNNVALGHAETRARRARKGAIFKHGERVIGEGKTILSALSDPPAGLEASTLDALIPLVRVGAGGSGGFTAARAVALAEIAAKDKKAFRAELKKMMDRKRLRKTHEARRRNSR